MQELQLNHVSTAASGADLHGMHRPRRTDSDVLREANRECPPTDSEFNKFHDKVLKSIEKNSNAIDKHFDKDNGFEIVDDKNGKKDLSQKLSTDLSKNEAKDKSKDKSIDMDGSLAKDKSKEKSIDLNESLSKEKSKEKSVELDGTLSKDKTHKDKSIEVDGSVIKDRIGSQSKGNSVDLEGSLSNSSSGGNRSGITYGDHVLRDKADFSRGGPARENSDTGASRGRQR